VTLHGASRGRISTLDEHTPEEVLPARGSRVTGEAERSRPARAAVGLQTSN